MTLRDAVRVWFRKSIGQIWVGETASQVCFPCRLCPFFQMTRHLVFSFLICPLLVAAPAEEQRIAALYARGLAGDKQAVNDCITALESRLAQAPNDQLARVYLGSSWTLRSRDL